MFKLQSLFLLAGLVVLFALVAFTLFGWLGALLVLGIGLAINWFSLGRAPNLILQMHRARPLAPWEAPGIHRLATDLARRASIARPHLMVYPSERPNAFAMGAQSERGLVALSSGLLNLLDGRETAGVLAHEFAHLKNRDSAFSLTAGLFVQTITGLSHLFGLLVLFLALSGNWTVLAPANWPLLVLIGLAPSAATLLQAGLMRTRERLADRVAAALTGDPRGLASALYKLQQYSRYLDRWMRRFRFIYTSTQETGSALLRTHPSTEERVRQLLNLEKAVERPLYRTAV